MTAEAQTQTPKPSVGRIVHYVMTSNGQHRPAIIVNLFDHPGEDAKEYTQLVVFLDGLNDNAPITDDRQYDTKSRLACISWETSVEHDETGHKPHTWHWPERV